MDNVNLQFSPPIAAAGATDDTQNPVHVGLTRWIACRLPSIQRIAAWTGTLLLHVLLVALLIRETRVVLQPRTTTALTVEIALDLPAPTPPPAPAAPTPTPEPVARASAPARSPAPAPAPAVASVRLPEAAIPPATTLGQRVEAQRVEAAATVAAEHAPPRRPFAGRDLDAMLPDGDRGTLPGFRPRTSEGGSEVLRKLGQVLNTRLPSAAVDFHAPMDQLTERWEASHHGSDLAACEQQYQDLDADLRRQMCGEVRPPE